MRSTVRNGSFLGIVAALGTLSIEAHAASELPLGFAVGAGALGLAGIIAAVLATSLLRRQKSPTTNEIAALKAAGADLAAALASAPGGYYRWSRADGGEVISERLARLFGAEGETLSRFDQFRAYIDEDDFARLSDAVAALREEGTPFHMTLRGRPDGRTFEVEGAAFAPAEPGRDGLALWFRDASAEARERAALSDRGARAEAQAAHWRARLEEVEFPVWTRDRDFAIAWCNKTYADWVESNPAEVAKKSTIELVSGYAASEARALARRALETGAPQRDRHHVVIAGSRRLLEIAEQPLPGAEGTIGFARDITELEEAQRELARHIGGHAEVLENLGTAIEIYGADKRLKYFNSAFLKMYRLDENWLQTEPSAGEVLEALREKRRLPEQADFPAFKKERLALFTSLTRPEESLLHMPDGSTVRQVVTPHPFGGLLYMSEDVTDRLALERSYDTLIAVQRATLDHLYEGVAVFGADGRLKLYNPVYSHLWKLPPQMLEGEPHVSEIVEHEKELFDYGDDWETYKASLIAHTTEHTHHVERTERRDNKVLDCASVPLPDGAILQTYLDVTDSIEVERALRERAEALETADRLKSEFIASVSYELRTPLNTIIGFTELLKNQYFGPLNERQAEYAHGILESSQHLLSLINSILDLAAIEAGHIVLDIGPVDVREMMESVFNLSNELAGRQNLTLRFECPPDIGGLEADERRLKQVLFNLLTNAIRFTPSGGTITLGAKRRPDGVEVWVADTGVGIDDVEKEHVFERFYRGSQAPSRHSGTGLGLSLVRSFVELHGGQVELESAPRRGTRVSCYLPAKPALVQAETA